MTTTVPSKNFESGECLTYQTAPLEELRKPGDSENCWHIYLCRKYDNTVPYTREAYRTKNFASDRDEYFTALGTGAVGTAMASGLVYFLGWLVG